MSFCVLAIDGGGVRGIFAAHILKRLAAGFSADPASVFDLIVGTSTGSIIAAGIAVGIEPSALCDLYEKHSKKVFLPAFGSLRGLLKSQYRNDGIKELAATIFGTETLGNVKKRLIIPATDVSNGNVYVFKSGYDAGFVRDRDTLVATAVQASCAAPGFFDPVSVGNYLVADGGLWANNPSMVGLTEALGRLHQSLPDIRLLSIGTGQGRHYYDPGLPNRAWGLATGWGGKKLVSASFALQSRTAENSARLILGDHYLRLNFESDSALTLDDSLVIPQLKARADEVFTYNAHLIKSLLALP